MYDKVNQNVGKYNKPKPRCKELVLIKKDSEPYDSKHLVKENGVRLLKLKSRLLWEEIVQMELL